MRFRWVCLTLCASQFCGCENPQPALIRVEPGQAYSDHDVRLTLLGDGFLPATTLDPASGRRVAVIDGFHARIGKDVGWAELTDLAWQSTGQMSASLLNASASGLPRGYLDVQITDPRGQRAALPNAFYEFGPDVTPPTITFTSPAPDAPVGPGTLLRGNFHASDAPPGALAELGWTYSEGGVARTSSSCRVTLQATEVDCGFQVKVGQSLRGGEQIQIVANAIDASAARNRTEATLSFTVLARPTIGSISPSSGGTAGGTDVVITGTSFLPGSQAILDGVPLFPDGGIVIDEHTLSGHVPAHGESSTVIVVRTPLGDAIGPPLVFTYLPPPLVETITPSTGAATGGTAVALTGKGFSKDTRIYFGSTLDSAVPLTQLFLQSDSAIIGRAPAGSGQTWVWAFDETLGFTRLPNRFTWRTP